MADFRESGDGKPPGRLEECDYFCHFLSVLLQIVGRGTGAAFAYLEAFDYLVEGKGFVAGVIEAVDLAVGFG
jgi:hypothetical protein|tara:strand:- start:536 stop:751 length:216 start_codon:yes stop_codon:yes gene_type:complete